MNKHNCVFKIFICAVVILLGAGFTVSAEDKSINSPQAEKAQYQISKGEDYEQKGNYAGPEEASRQAISILREAWIKTGRGRAYFYLSLVLEKQGRLAEAEQNALEAVALESLFKRKLLMVDLYEYIGELQAMQGKFETALGNYGKALAIVKEVGF